MPKAFSQITENSLFSLLTAFKELQSRFQSLIEGNAVSKKCLQLPPALDFLSQCFNLSALEAKILLLCLAQELDPEIPQLCAQAQGNSHYSYPTFSLAFRLFNNLDWQVISPNAPLRYWQLIDLIEGGNLPLAFCSLKADQRIIDYVIEVNKLDRRLNSLFFRLNSAQAQKSDCHLPLLSPSQQHKVSELCHSLKALNGGSSLPIIQLLGSDSQSKQQIAEQVSGNLGRSLYGLLAELLPQQNSGYLDFMRLWQRENALLPLALYIDTQAIPSASNGIASLRRFLSDSQGLIFLNSREANIPSHRDTLTVEIDKPTPSEQREVWTKKLGKKAGNNPGLLIGQFSLNLTDIEGITKNVLDNSQLKPKELTQALWKACLKHTVPHLENLAQRLETKATWQNLVLPTEQTDLLLRIVQQVRQRSIVYDDWKFREQMNRGLGISALFAGESGTGKTMAAEVLAQELQLNLYRIDLSSVVSKYIGETEKNLRQLFDAAETGGAILFFDEADALFGKRSEVRDSHDRYANIETNYLLQRLESYQGLAILATNFKKSLDSAFLRRLRFIIDFPFPSPEYRRLMWQKAFPTAVPLGKINYRHLAKLNLTGGLIHNIALNAAFIAAQDGVAVGMEQILAATRMEFRKLERPIFESDFQWEETEEDEEDSDY